MRQPALVAFVLCGGIALTGCAKKAPAPLPPPPAAPATPPPAPPPTPEKAPQLSEYDQVKAKSLDEIERMGLLGDIHFDFDRYDIRQPDTQVLARNAEQLKKFDFLKITIEGHCDERGSVEYNLALGDRRAKAAFDYLLSLGVPADRMKTVSYGKEVPLCQQSTEECWTRNRRAHFAVTGKTQ